jgi:hypothetical protein
MENELIFIYNKNINYLTLKKSDYKNNNIIIINDFCTLRMIVIVFCFVFVIIIVRKYIIII